MSQRVFGIVSTLEEADQFARRMQDMGPQSNEVIVAGKASELESVLHPQCDFMYSTRVGVLAGAIVGCLVGIAQAIYIGPEELTTWIRVATIVFCTTVGWAIFGAIVGGSGIFARRRIPHPVEHLFEAEVARARILVCAQFREDGDVEAVRTALADSGARSIYMQRARRARTAQISG